MSIIPNITIWLSDAKKTHSAGVSLGSSLYTLPVDIVLTGELGAGKTTFLQGFFSGIGISQQIVSPTYALEQRYRSPRFGEVLHLDLYRLEPRAAHELIEQSNGHSGIRCIEWANRLETPLSETIALSFSEHANGRELTISFEDMPLPSSEQIKEWRADVKLPEHIARHCDRVADIASQLGEALIQEGKIVRIEALQRAGEVHDLLRFIDFKPGASHADHKDPPETLALWASLKEKYPSMEHEAACATFLREHGYSGLADIVEVHGLKLPEPERTTIEQQLLFYADKRVAVDTLVSLDERFADFAVRYGNGEATERGKIWLAECKTLEELLFPNGVPTLR